MWGRVVEMMTAVWLLLSPFIFQAQENPYILWGDTATALLITLLSGLSYWYPLRHAHFAILFVAIGLVIAGRFLTPPPAVAAQQNHIAVGLFLMMIAIIPNSASLPPSGWCKAIELGGKHPG
jgi:hypothetical protein